MGARQFDQKVKDAVFPAIAASATEVLIANDSKSRYIDKIDVSLSAGEITIKYGTKEACIVRAPGKVYYEDRTLVGEILEANALGTTVDGKIAVIFVETATP